MHRRGGPGVASSIAQREVTAHGYRDSLRLLDSEKVLLFGRRAPTKWVLKMLEGIVQQAARPTRWSPHSRAVGKKSTGRGISVPCVGWAGEWPTTRTRHRCTSQAEDGTDPGNRVISRLRTGPCFTLKRRWTLGGLIFTGLGRVTAEAIDKRTAPSARFSKRCKSREFSPRYS